MHNKILFVGPASFNQNTWETRANYILPDLFSSVGTDAQLFMLTPPVPDFARDSLHELCQRFSISHIVASSLDLPGESIANRWKQAVEHAARDIRPAVITNSLGSLRLGEAIVHGATESGARAVIRVAGDEIASRLAMGTYDKADAWYKKDCLLERAGFVGADAVIAMSPWEKERIEKIIGKTTEKISVCIRGVNLEKFTPAKTGSTNKRIRRILYVGRKSAEKGYDIIEAAAKQIYTELPEVEFVFVGDFEPGQFENRRYVGWVAVEDLPDLYRSVDAFVLTSRTEGFPQVVAEAMATGLPCILSKHLFEGVFRHQKDALLAALEPTDVAEKIRMLVDDPVLAENLSLRSRALAEATMDQEYWRRQYSAILFGSDNVGKTTFDVVKNASKIGISDNGLSLPRIAYILPRVFGIMGTQGSYGMATAFAKFTPTLVISRLAVTPVALPIVANDDGLEHHYQVDFSRPSAKEEIAALIDEFRPDIVHFVNDHSWVSLLPFLKSRYPAAQYVMDFQTPLLAEGDKRDSLQIAGQKQAKNIDLAITLSTDIAQSWIPSYKGPLTVYPLGIVLDQIQQRTESIPAELEKVRFVYVGQTHPKRKLPMLLELIAGLEPEIKDRFTLDIFGAGGGEEEIDSQITKLGLENVVARHAPVPQDELFALLLHYDCGIAWVPRETYDEAPSLKFLEFAAAKIGVIATDTLAHRRNVEDGFQVNLFKETVDSFEAAVREVMAGNITSAIRDSNYEVVSKYDFEWIAKNVLLPEYSALAMKNGEAERKLRLMFVTPRPLGLIATPGTYLSVEAYSKHCDVRVIAKPRTSEDEIIVHKADSSIPVELLDPQQPDYASQVVSAAQAFQPDIVCLTSWPGWHYLSSALRPALPGALLVLEVKSPVVTKNADRLRKDRVRWQNEHLMLDAIIAPSRGMVETFIGKIERPFLQHRSIINFSEIEKKTYANESIKCRKFVFSGSLAKLRQLDKLFRLFAQLPTDVLERIHLDVFGDGPARAELVTLVDELGLNQKIQFMGAVPQKELFQRYKDYEAGLAWVPKELYDSAPSLKLIEYCAAGLVPLATSSAGHRLLDSYGFSIDYFEEDDVQSFVQAVTKLCMEGAAQERMEKNIHLAEAFDFRSVIGKEILPFYRKVLQAKENGIQMCEVNVAPSLTHTSAKSIDPYLAWADRTASYLQGNQILLKREGGITYERALHARRMRNKLPNYRQAEIS